MQLWHLAKEFFKVEKYYQRLKFSELNSDYNCWENFVSYLAIPMIKYLFQVSHHPPMVAMYTESLTWSSWQEFTMSSKFRGKYLQIIPLG